MLKIIDSVENNIRKEAQEYKKLALSRHRKYIKTKELSYLSDAKYYLNEHKERLRRLDKCIKERITISSEEIVNLLDIYVPNQWCIEENIIYIHYPQVTVTNDNGEQHEVTNVYLKIELCGYRVSDINISARRMSATPEEITNDYCHSHITNNGLKEFTPSICFGKDFKWRNDDYLLSLEYLLVHFKLFLETESSNTNPYSLLSGIKTLKGEYSSYNIKYDFNIIPFDVDIIYHQGLPIFQPRNNEKLDEYLVNTYKEATAYEKDGKYYQRQDTIKDVKAPIQNSKFIFKGKEIKFKILPSKNKVVEKTFNNHFKNYFIYHAGIEITKIINSFTTTKSKSPVDNIRTVVQEDTISLFQD